MSQHSDQFIEDISTGAEEVAAHEDWVNSQQEEYEAQSALDLFQKGLTKAQIRGIKDTTVENVLIHGNPLLVAEALSAMELYIKEVRADKRFMDYVREEAAKSPKGFVSPSGAKIELAETGTSYNFDQCNDPVLFMFEQSLQTAKDNIEERKKFLKSLPQCGLDIVSPDGEVLKIYPPSKSSTSSYKVSLKAN